MKPSIDVGAAPPKLMLVSFVFSNAPTIDFKLTVFVNVRFPVSELQFFNIPSIDATLGMLNVFPIVFNDVQP